MDKKMFVRFIGNKICFTLEDERFYMANVEECSEKELQVANNGGGYLPVSNAMNIVAK